MRTLKICFLMAVICALGKTITFNYGNPYATGFVAGIIATIAVLEACYGKETKP